MVFFPLRTLEYLSKHLTHLAAFSSLTNMHARNLALVWAPNLLRSKENEILTCNGDTAFLEVRVQQAVVEFILNHMDQIFNNKPGQSIPKEEGQSSACEPPYVMTNFAAPGQYAPMKLMSLEEAQARTLNAKHPARRECPQESDAAEGSTTDAKMYHTVIDMPSNKRSFSGKSKKWKTIFSLGGSTNDTKRKLTWNGSVFIKSSKLAEKATIRPAKSMDSLCSLSKDDGEFKQPTKAHISAAPAFKSHTLDSNCSYDLSKEDEEWNLEPENMLGATADIPNPKKKGNKGDSLPRQRKLPEQLKVFKGDDHCHPTSPKNRRMLYSGNTNSGSSRTSFPGKLFPLESSAQHPCKALNISEPFAVSVPLRVSAVISSNSTLCRVLDKDKHSHPLPEPISEAPVSEKNRGRRSSSTLKKEGVQAGSSRKVEAACSMEARKGENTDLKESSSKGVISEPQLLLPVRAKHAPCRPPHLQTQPTSSSTLEQNETGQETLCQAHMATLLPKELVGSEKRLVTPQKHHSGLRKLTKTDEKASGKRMDQDWDGIDYDLKEIKSSVDVAQDKPKAKLMAKSKSSSLLNDRSNSLTLNDNHHTANFFTLRDMPVRQLSFDWDSRHYTEFKEDSNTSPVQSFDAYDELNKPDLPLTEKSDTISNMPLPVPQSQHKCPEYGKTHSNTTQNRNAMTREQPNVPNDELKIKEAFDPVSVKIKMETVNKNEHKGDRQKIDPKRRSMSLSQSINKSPSFLELADNDDEESLGDNMGDLELVEPWEDNSGTKHWVTSPLHSPKTLNFFQSQEELLSCLMGESYKSNKYVREGKKNELGDGNSTEISPGKSLQVHHHKNTHDENTQPPNWENIPANEVKPKFKGKDEKLSKQKNNCSFQRPKRQRSQDSSCMENTKENSVTKQRPRSLNLNLETLYIKDASEQENFDFLPGISLNQKSLPKYGCSSTELKKFLCNRQASMRRNSAPVSVSSVRTSFMIKTSQANAVPVKLPKIQYSQIPQPLPANNADSCPNKELENDPTGSSKMNKETTSPLLCIRNSDVNVESSQPALANPGKVSNGYPTVWPQKPSEFRNTSHGDAFGDFARLERPTVMKRPSFRARPNRPQSLILFTPPFPSMDCPPAADDDKILLSPIKSPTEMMASDVLSKELAEFEDVSLRRKMTMPKSGQRLETSTSCFYQPQRRSMIFDSRGNRQNE
uniref:Rho GTPase activating protein 31 n=1 Tax=Paramormyrops kingsleyae TaxID=1676925 RepID=A0A3B3T000_9TELE